MKILFKKFHADAKIPTRGSEAAAGYDLTAVTEMVTDKGAVYQTGLGVVIPDGYVGLIFPRSSIYKTGLTLSNCVGVIDSDYRGEISFVFRKEKNGTAYQLGDRIGQLVIVQHEVLEFEEVSELPDSKRGSNGFGSTGA